MHKNRDSDFLRNRQRSMFDVHFLVNPSYETALPKFLFRLDRPLFWPAAPLNPEPRNLEPLNGYQFTIFLRDMRYNWLKPAF